MIKLGSQPRRFKQKPADHKARPQIELLEARNLLSNVIVNKAAEDTTSQDTQSETSIVLSGSNIVVAFNDSEENASGTNHFTGFSTSSNGGTSFTDGDALPASSGGDAGDPSLAANTSNSNVYLTTLGYSSSNVVQFFKSTNNGTSFASPVNVAPGFASSDVLDKDWTTVDNFAGSGNGNIYVTYNDFRAGGFFDNGIFLSKSTNAGASWTKFGKVTTAGNSVEGSNVVVGADHAVYVFWWDGNSSTEAIKMRKSTNQASTFGSISTVATLKTTGSDGDLGLNFRTNAFPIAAANPTNSSNIYVIFNDKGKTSGDRGDVYFTQSNNGGSSWTTPVKLNDDTGTRDQWQPAIAVTPDGTHMFITWYDRRNAGSQNGNIERYGVVGTITGSTVSFGANFRVDDSASGFPESFGQDPSVVSDYMGDYDVAAADNSYFYTVWGDNRNSDAAHTHQPDVFFSKVTIAGVPTSPRLVVQGTATQAARPVANSGSGIALALSSLLDSPSASNGLSPSLPLGASLLGGTSDTRSAATGQRSPTLTAAAVTQVFASGNIHAGSSLIALTGAGDADSEDVSAPNDDLSWIDSTSGN